jgi:hypothetical protein
LFRETDSLVIDSPVGSTADGLEFAMKTSIPLARFALVGLLASIGAALAADDQAEKLLGRIEAAKKSFETARANACGK